MVGAAVRQSTCGLARLVEEAERERDYAIRSAALDTWDQLIEAGVLSAWTALDDRLQE